MDGWTKRLILAKNALVYLAILVLGGLVVYLWTNYVRPPAPVYVSKPSGVRVVEVPKWREKVRTKLVPVEAEIEFFKKEEVEKEMEGPVPDNVVAIGQVPPYLGKTTVVSSLESREGALHGVLTYRQEKMPFVQLQRTFGVRGGYGTDGAMGEMFIQPLRVGPGVVEGRVYGNIGGANSDSRVGAAILIEVKF